MHSSLQRRRAPAGRLSGSLPVTAPATIWKPIPVRIFYRDTFVIYQGNDMDILSGKSYDIIYHGHIPWIDMNIPNANNLERHILVIYFLTFGQIFQNVIYVGYPNHKYCRMSYVWDI